MPAFSIPPSLTQLEWTVVSLAYQDAMECDCATFDGESLFNRIMALLFGRRKPNSLADPKLEAVRRFGCTSRRRGYVEDTAIDTLAKYGLSPAQIDALAMLAI